MAKRYSLDFEPVLLEDDTAILFGKDLPSEGLNVRCITMGALPEYYKDFGAITATVWDNDNEDTNLEMNPMEMAQMRFRIIDDVKCRLKNPAALQQWRTKAAVWYLPQFPDGEDRFLQEYYWRASEFFVWEDNTPRFDLYSTTTTTEARIIFCGWRFKLAKIDTVGKVKIWLANWPSTS